MQKGKEINNVSATTAIELKAELAQQVEQFEKTRSSSGKQVVAKRPEKKATVWSRQNKGINERNQKDKAQQISNVEADILEKSRLQLEKKAKLYEDMRSGKYQFNDDDDFDEDKMPLVDFDKKYFQEKELNKSEKKRKRVEEQEEQDPWVEHVDEFGRTRIVRQSELSKQEYSSEDEKSVDYLQGPSEDSILAADRTDMEHYEAEREIRTKGVGFYQFSRDEQERKEQLDKLNKLRQETENARQAASSSAEKRRQMLAKNADKIRARKAALKAKKHQLSEPQEVNIPAVTEHSVTDFLKSVRKQVE